MPQKNKPLVSIIMGSQSDYSTMKFAEDTLKSLQIKFDTKIVSAHRTPKRLFDFASKAALDAGPPECSDDDAFFSLVSAVSAPIFASRIFWFQLFLLWQPSKLPKPQKKFSFFPFFFFSFLFFFFSFFFFSFFPARIGRMNPEKTEENICRLTICSVRICYK